MVRKDDMVLALYGALPPWSGQCASPPTVPLVLWCSLSAPPRSSITTASPLRSHLQDMAFMMKDEAWVALQEVQL